MRLYVLCVYSLVPIPFYQYNKGIYRFRIYFFYCVRKISKGAFTFFKLFEIWLSIWKSRFFLFSLSIANTRECHSFEYMEKGGKETEINKQIPLGRCSLDSEYYCIQNITCGFHGIHRLCSSREKNNLQMI